MDTVRVDGFGLHTGAAVRVLLESQPGFAVTLRVAEFVARVDELSVVSTDRATTVAGRGGKPRVGTVEHAFAALAGMCLHDGISIAVDGPEMPLLDGGAAAWCDALSALGALPSARPPLRITRHAVLRVEESAYQFDPGDRVEVEVCIDFDDTRIARDARWAGDANDFRARIAPARTFAFERDLEEFMRRGLARHVPPDAVIVFTPDAILSSGALFSPDEPARHKLLDVLGDLYVHGGPPRGRVRAFRPGHAANARAFAQARADEILAIA